VVRDLGRGKGGGGGKPNPANPTPGRAQRPNRTEHNTPTQRPQNTKPRQHKDPNGEGGGAVQALRLLSLPAVRGVATGVCQQDTHAVATRESRPVHGTSSATLTGDGRRPTTGDRYASRDAHTVATRGSHATTGRDNIHPRMSRSSKSLPWWTAFFFSRGPWNKGPREVGADMPPRASKPCIACCDSKQTGGDAQLTARVAPQAPREGSERPCTQAAMRPAPHQTARPDRDHCRSSDREEP
jgi:hypothetical protein